MRHGVEEALAVSPDGRSWVVAQDGGLVFGRLDGSQMLAQATQRSPTNLVWPFVASPADQPSLLSIGTTGKIVAASATSSLMTRNEAGLYRTSDNALPGRARFS